MTVTIENQSEISSYEETKPEGSNRSVSDAKSNIRVAVRVRGLLSVEYSQGAKSNVRVLDGKLIILLDPGSNVSCDFLRVNKSRERRYAFDRVFDEFASQKAVYDQACAGIIAGVLRGVNSTIFAYGATGAGKTYTMFGTETQPGLMSLTVSDLFTQLQSLRESMHVVVKCSFVEVYNENVRDLLGSGQDLSIREDPIKGMCVAGVCEVSGLSDVSDIMNLLNRGNRNRTMEPTSANITSSRSHAILQVIVELTEKGQGMVSNVLVGKLSLIDLAGSERASVTNNRGIRLLEGANINKSLLALGNCITALAEKGSFIPYRDSKLTRLLKDSLGGNCTTVMIANISVSHLNFEDTSNTLKYANRAKNILPPARFLVGPKPGKVVSQHISNYHEIVGELKNVIFDLKNKLSTKDSIQDTVKIASEQWKQELMDNVDERISLKRVLIDIKRDIRQLGESDEHEELFARRDLITDRIVANENAMLLLQETLPTRVQNEDVCAFLLLLYRNQILEIELMEKEEYYSILEKRLKDELNVKDATINSLLKYAPEGSLLEHTSHRVTPVSPLAPPRLLLEMTPRRIVQTTRVDVGVDTIRSKENNTRKLRPPTAQTQRYTSRVAHLQLGVEGLPVAQHRSRPGSKQMRHCFDEFEFYCNSTCHCMFIHTCIKMRNFVNVPKLYCKTAHICISCTHCFVNPIMIIDFK